MPDETTQLLADLQAYSKEGLSYVFISTARLAMIKRLISQGRWNTTCHVVNNLNRNFDVIRRNSGIPRCTIHDLRRSAITNWARYFPIQLVQQLAGHSNITTTRKYYLAVQPENMASAIKVINEILARSTND